MSRARDRALLAERLLEGLDDAQRHLDSLDEDDRLQMAVTGGYSRVNADLKFTVEVAVANALAALALALTEQQRAGAGIR